MTKLTSDKIANILMLHMMDTDAFHKTIASGLRTEGGHWHFATDMSNWPDKLHGIGWVALSWGRLTSVAYSLMVKWADGDGHVQDAHWNIAIDGNPPGETCNWDQDGPLPSLDTLHAWMVIIMSRQATLCQHTAAELDKHMGSIFPHKKGSNPIQKEDWRAKLDPVGGPEPKGN